MLVHCAARCCRAAGPGTAGGAGACSGLNGCQVTMDGAKTVTATFQANVPLSISPGPGPLPNGATFLVATFGPA